MLLQRLALPRNKQRSPSLCSSRSFPSSQTLEFSSSHQPSPTRLSVHRRSCLQDTDHQLRGLLPKFLLLGYHLQRNPAKSVHFYEAIDTSISPVIFPSSTHIPSSS